jgi:hypothetical protein
MFSFSRQWSEISLITIYLQNWANSHRRKMNLPTISSLVHILGWWIRSTSTASRRRLLWVSSLQESQMQKDELFNKFNLPMAGQQNSRWSSQHHILREGPGRKWGAPRRTSNDAMPFPLDLSNYGLHRLSSCSFFDHTKHETHRSLAERPQKSSDIEACVVHAW